jgi:hexokinase
LTTLSIKKLPVALTALINDTTGTLIASHYVNPKAKIACIFGTGCNAAYMEHVSDIPKLKNLGIDGSADMAINCEWVRSTLFLRSSPIFTAYPGRL